MTFTGIGMIRTSINRLGIKKGEKKEREGEKALPRRGCALGFGRKCSSRGVREEETWAPRMSQRGKRYSWRRKEMHFHPHGGPRSDRRCK